MPGYSQVPSRIGLQTEIPQQAYSQHVPGVMPQHVQHAVVSSQLNQIKQSPPGRTSVAIVAPMILEVDQNSKVQVPFFYNVNQLLGLPNRSLQHDAMLHNSSVQDGSASQILHQAPQNSSNQHKLRADTVEGAAAEAHDPTYQKSINQQKSNTETTAPIKQDSISQLGKAANMILKTKRDDIQTIDQNMLDVSNNTAAKIGKPQV